LSVAAWSLTTPNPNGLNPSDFKTICCTCWPQRLNYNFHGMSSFPTWSYWLLNSIESSLPPKGFPWKLMSNNSDKQTNLSYICMRRGRMSAVCRVKHVTLLAVIINSRYSLGDLLLMVVIAGCILV
jgi:hypothetical protein